MMLENTPIQKLEYVKENEDNCEKTCYVCSKIILASRPLYLFELSESITSKEGNTVSSIHKSYFFCAEEYCKEEFIKISTYINNELMTVVHKRNIKFGTIVPYTTAIRQGIRWHPKLGYNHANGIVEDEGEFPVTSDPFPMNCGHISSCAMEIGISYAICEESALTFFDIIPILRLCKRLCTIKVVNKFDNAIKMINQK